MYLRENFENSAMVKELDRGARRRVEEIKAEKAPDKSNSGKTFFQRKNLIY